MSKIKKISEFENIPEIDKETGMYKHSVNENIKTPKEYFPKIKIIVDSEQSKDQVLKALEHLHNSDFNSDLIAANSLVHHYLYPDSVEVKPDYDFDAGEQR